MTANLTEAVWRAVAQVVDPELLVATVEDLGILEGVRVTDGRVEVDLVPTFLGCPALEVIREDVARAARSVSGVEDVEVRFRSHPVWTPERITARGRARLGEDLTIAVREAGRPVVCPLCGSVSVEERSQFGPTACRAVGYCSDCRNPIEVVRR